MATWRAVTAIAERGGYRTVGVGRDRHVADLHRDNEDE
jgi:hypothetical protein